MRRGFLGIVLVLVLVPARARATDLYTSPMFVPANIVVRCFLANVGSKPLKELESEALRLDGSFAYGNSSTQLEAGRSTYMYGSSSEDRMLRCHWSFGGSARKVRAGICVDLLGCLPAS